MPRAIVVYTHSPFVPFSAIVYTTLKREREISTCARARLSHPQISHVCQNGTPPDDIGDKIWPEKKTIQAGKVMM